MEKNINLQKKYLKYKQKYLKSKTKYTIGGAIPPEREHIDININDF